MDFLRRCVNRTFQPCSAFMYVCVWYHMYVCIHVCMCLWYHVYVCMYVYTYACMCIYVWLHVCDKKRMNSRVTTRDSKFHSTRAKSVRTSAALSCECNSLFYVIMWECMSWHAHVHAHAHARFHLTPKILSFKFSMARTWGICRFQSSIETSMQIEAWNLRGDISQPLRQRHLEPSHVAAPSERTQTMHPVPTGKKTTPPKSVWPGWLRVGNLDEFFIHVYVVLGWRMFLTAHSRTWSMYAKAASSLLLGSTRDDRCSIRRAALSMGRASSWIISCRRSEM
jgi:hypothetical protein